MSYEHKCICSSLSVQTPNFCYLVGTSAAGCPQAQVNSIAKDSTLLFGIRSPAILDPFVINQTDIPIPNAWNRNTANRLTFADQIRINNEQEHTRLEYIPPVDSPIGGKRVIISTKDLRLSAKNFSLHLYGYFLGTSMDFEILRSPWLDLINCCY
ncbi:hypothetical protein L1987_40596 [Smallanthus sonchifolius]|uniref:Uncharacterized protein n=1 Tax=Smallanthus sonchifolius TaxID=185202 RepID=A0ACB9GT74_9ASTR|nr:hypothetical protein L1987_40596 [Smallanthus sonchifolius]